jgi:hypothetical protein
MKQLSKLWSELYRIVHRAPVKGKVAKGTLYLLGFNETVKKTYVHPTRRVFCPF